MLLSCQLFLGGLGGLLSILGAAEPAATGVLWQGDPIPVRLTVAQERRLTFPEVIADLDVPVALQQASRIVLTPQGQVYWQANEPFAPDRVLAVALSGTLYQLDVSALRQASAADAEPLVILNPVLLANPPAPPPTAAAQKAALAEQLIPDFLKGGGREAGTGDDYVALTRFALAHYFGPERLIPDLAATPIPVRQLNTEHWLRVPAASLRIEPLQQWQVGERYVSALGVYNPTAQPVTFDPRALRGAWLFVATLQPTLGAAGRTQAGTVWAVVTAQPVARALGTGP